MVNLGGGSEVSIIVRAYDRFSATFEKAGMKMKTLSANAKKFQTSLLIAGAAITAIGVAGAMAFTGLAKEASNAQEIFTKFDAVFDDVGAKGEETAKDLRDNFGLATSSAKELLSGTGDLLTGMGMAGNEALDMASKIAKLGIDLASFQNLQGGATQAVNIMNKAILGERESLTTLGVKILEADVQQKVLEMGMQDLTGTARLEARAIATLQLIVEQTGKAQGDFARTQEGFANQSRIASERVKELKEQLGAHLLPIFTKLVGVVSKVAEWFGNLSDRQQKFIVFAGLTATVLALIIGPLLILVALLPSIAAGLAFVSVGLTAVTIAGAPLWIIIIAIIAAITAVIAIILNWGKIMDFF